MTDHSPSDKSRRLGRGLDALIGLPTPPSVPVQAATPRSSVATPGDVPREAPYDHRLQDLPITHIRPNPFQPRREFDDEELRELEDSLRTTGLLQPVTVRRVGAEYELIAGERRLRAAMAFGIVSTVLALPWILWVRSQTGAAPELYTYYTSTSYKDWNVLFGFPFSEKLSVVGRNAFFLLVEPARLIGLHSPLLWPLLLVFGVLAVMGFVIDARRKTGVLHVFTVLYVATLLLWAWPPGRFLLPIYPLVLFYAALGGLWILRRVAQPRAARVAAAGVVAMLAFVAAWQSAMQARNATTRGRACLGNTCERRWTEFVDVMSWLENNTPRNATLLGAQDPMLYLYTGRKALRSFESNPVALFYSSDPGREPLGPPARLGERMAASGADYLVMTRRDGSLEDDLLARQVRALRRARAELLKPEMTIGSPDFGVYRIDLGDGASTAAVIVD